MLKMGFPRAGIVGEWLGPTILRRDFFVNGYLSSSLGVSSLMVRHRDGERGVGVPLEEQFGEERRVESNKIRELIAEGFGRYDPYRDNVSMLIIGTGPDSILWLFRGMSSVWINSAAADIDKVIERNEPEGATERRSHTDELQVPAIQMTSDHY